MSKDPLIISGGSAIIFGASLVLDMRKKSIQEVDPITMDQGMKIGLTVKKNHCTPAKNPYVKVDYFIIFGEGTEQYLETLENAFSKGILTKAGAFIKDVDESGEVKMLDGIKLQWQGKESFRKFCVSNPVYFKYLQDSVDGVGVVSLTPEEIEEVIAEEEDIKKSVPLEEKVALGKKKK